MKKGLLLTVILCFVSANFALFAQPGDKDGKKKFEKFKAERVEFISKIMELTDDEKTAFWPICDELQMKKFELNKQLRDEMREIHKAKKDKEKITEAKYKKIIELKAQLKLKEAQLEQEYLAKFLKVVSAEKVFLYQSAENQFGRKMFGNQKNQKNQKKKN